MKNENLNPVKKIQKEESIKPWLETIGIVLAGTTSISFLVLFVISYALGINILA